MQFVIHRGTQEIGGSCVEVQSGKSRILLDLGLPLVDPKNPKKKLEVNLRCESPTKLRERGILPSISGLWADVADGPSVNAILLSHPHQDHHGLLSFIRKDIPVYLSADALRILNRSDIFIRPGANIGRATFLNDRCIKMIKDTPFKVTPFLMDHSAYGTMAYLIEAGGRRLFYSGDFRGHGRKSALFEKFCRMPPQPVDRLLLEGTTLGSDSHEARTEQELENDLIKLLRQYSGLKLVSVSGQNIDRLVTIYRACKRSGHTFVLDLYTASMLEATNGPRIPHASPEWRDGGVLRVIFTPFYKSRIQNSKEKSYRKTLELAESFQITPEEISKQPGRHVMIFRESLLKDYSAIANNGKGVLIYSQWSGYMKEPSFIKTEAVLKQRGFEVKQCHTSGHASKTQMRRFIAALNPAVLSPMHTFHGELALDLWKTVELLEDGVPCSV